jgi:DUF971 family protein
VAISLRGLDTPQGCVCWYLRIHKPESRGVMLCWQLVHGRRHVGILSLEAVGSYALR